MATLGDAYINIIPTTDGISGKLSDALGAPAEQAGKQAGSKAGGGMLGSIAKVVGGGAAVVAGAATAMTGAMVAGAKGVAEYGDNIDKMSQKIGISAEEYQKWDYVMARAGTSVDVMKSGMKTLSAQATSNSEAFQKLGISAEDAANMSNGELFQAAVEKLSGMEEGAERTTLATQLLGKAGLEMGPLFNEGTEAISEQMQMAEDYGMIMSDDMVAASAAFQDSMETLSRTASGLGNTLLGELLPSLTEITDGLGLVFSGNTEAGVEALSQGIQDMAGTISEAIPTILEVGGELILSLAQAVIDNAPELLANASTMMTDMLTEISGHLPDLLTTGWELITNLATGILENAPEAITNMGSVMQDVLSNILDNLPQMLDSGVQLLGQLAQGLLNNGPEVITSIAGVIADMLTEIGTHLPELLQKGIELIGQMAAGLIQAIPDIVGKIPEIIDNIKDKFSETDWGKIGSDIIKGIADGISTAAGKIVDAAKEAASKALHAAKEFLGIASPSKVMRDQVGKFISAGIAEGITDNEGLITAAMDDATDLTGSINANLGYTAGGSSASGVSYGGFTINVYGAPGQDINELADIISDRINDSIRTRQAVFA